MIGSAAPIGQKSSSEEEYKPDQFSHGENAPLIGNPDRRGWCLQNRETVVKISFIGIGCIAFVGTLCGFIIEIEGSRNFNILSPFALINGASVAVIGHFLTPAQYRRTLTQGVSRVAYEVLFFTSQVVLNVPRDLTKLFTETVVWQGGVFVAKDILTLTGLQLHDLPISADEPPEERKRYRTICCSPWDFSRRSKLILTAFATSAAGLIVINFVFNDQYSKAGDLAEISLQNLIALFAGIVYGNIFARLADYIRVYEENKNRGLAVTPLKIRLLRQSRNVFQMALPLSTILMLAAQAKPNSILSFLQVFGSSLMMGAFEFLLRKDFENPDSSLHSFIEPPKSQEVILSQEKVRRCCCSINRETEEKVKQFLHKYSFSMLCMGGLFSFMVPAALDNTLKVDGAIIVLLPTTVASFLATDRVAVTFRPSPNNYFRNELYLQLLFSATTISIIYQIVRSTVEIGSQNLKDSSDAVYGLGLFGWFLWAIIVGNNRALHCQPRGATLQTLLTPPIATEEAAIAFTGTLIPRTASVASRIASAGTLIPCIASVASRIASIETLIPRIASVAFRISAVVVNFVFQAFRVI